MKNFAFLFLTLGMFFCLISCGAQPQSAKTDAPQVSPQIKQEDIDVAVSVADDKVEEQQIEAMSEESEAVAESEVAEEDTLSAEEKEIIPTKTSDDSTAATTDKPYFGGLATYNGKLVRAYPAGYDVDSLWNAQVDELVYIGDILYQGSARVWTVKDTTTPPENFVPTDGSIGMRDCNGSPARVFPEGYDTNMMLPVEPFERVYIGDVEYLYDGIEWGVVDNTPVPNQYTEIDGELDENGNLILSGKTVFH